MSKGFLKNSARVSTVFIGFALPAAIALARVLPQVDALANAPMKPTAQSAAVKAALADIAGVHTDARLGVPTFLWSGQASKVLEASSRPVASKAGLDPVAAARAHLVDLGALYGLSAADVEALSMFNRQSMGNGVSIVRFRNQIDGVEVFREEANLLLDRNQNLLSLSGYVMGRGENGASASRGGNAKRSPEMAIAAALADYGFQPAVAAQLQRSKGQGGYDNYALPAGMHGDDGAELASSVRIKPVLFRLPEGLISAYYLEVQVKDSVDTRKLDTYAYVIADNDGTMLFRNNQTADVAFSYRVYAEATSTSSINLPLPSPVGRTNFPHPSGIPDNTYTSFVTPNLVTLQNLTFSKNDPWLAADATTTKGNNVEAFADLFSPDGVGTVDAAECNTAVTPSSDFHACVSGTNAFDYTYDTSKAPTANKTQSMASVTGMFYTTNWLHDWYYDAGFDEAAGNAQDSNFGRGGVEKDSMIAEAQDFAGMNNANMMTPADGGRPRMRMYLSTGPVDGSVNISAPTAVAGSYRFGTASFGPDSFSATGAIVASVPANGCGTTAPLTNAAALAGKIALIMRGVCNFTEKAKNAQNAGAIGVIIGNNRDATVAPGMSGDDPSITIGTLSVSQNDAVKFNANITGLTGSLSKIVGVNRDGTLDNATIAHEWGHYISNRLIGNASGISNTQARGMGEGWADFHALLLLVKEGDAAMPNNANYTGAYPVGGYTEYGAQGQLSGIRRYPYSSDLTKNPLTLKHIVDGVALPATPVAAFGTSGLSNAEVHNTGEVWTSMLWSCYSNLLRDNKRLSFNEAQKRMKSYLVAGYKLTPIAPTFVEARDALLSAIRSQSTEDFNLCYQGFAARGAGAGAVIPDRYTFDNVGVIESFATVGLEFVSATLADSAINCDSDGVLDNNEIATMTIKMRNTGMSALSASSATVKSSNPNIVFPNGATASFPAAAVGETVSATLAVSLSGATGIGSAGFAIAVKDTAVSYTPLSGAAEFTVNFDQKGGQSKTDDVESTHTVWTPGSDVTGTAQASSLAVRMAVSALDHRWAIPSLSGNTQTWLASPPLNVVGKFGFTFKHRYGFEYDSGTYYDGGFIEISDDAGKTWTQIPGSAISGGYSGMIDEPTNPRTGLDAFIADSAAYPDLESVSVDLGTAYNGKTVMVRFIAAADAAGTSTGWEIDDIAFTGITNKPFDTVSSPSRSCVASMVLSGKRADYTIAKTASGYTVADKVGGAAQTVTTTRIKFADTSVALDIDGNAGKIYRMYQIAFNRRADTSGMGFFLDAVESGGASLDQVAKSLLASTEWTNNSAEGSNALFVIQLYTKGLRRFPDRAGMDFFVNGLDAGNFTRSQVLMGMAESAENQAYVLPSIVNGIGFTPASSGNFAAPSDTPQALVANPATDDLSGARNVEQFLNGSAKSEKSDN